MFTFFGAVAASDVEVVDILEVEDWVDMSLLTEEILLIRYYA